MTIVDSRQQHPPETGKYFLSWIGNSFHGEMDWIAREKCRTQVKSWKILPGAKQSFAWLKVIMREKHRKALRNLA